jgi:hypothetical protein
LAGVFVVVGDPAVVGTPRAVVGVRPVVLDPAVVAAPARVVVVVLVAL